MKPSVLLTIAPPAATISDSDSVEAKSTRVAQRIDPSYVDMEAQAAKLGLSPDSIMLVRTWGLLPDLLAVKAMPATGASDAQTLVRLVRKQNLSDAILAYQFDIRRAVNQVDAQLAKASYIRAVLSDRRDKAIRLNSYAGLVAGGLTGVLSGSFGLGEYRVVADIIDINEGVMEAGLAGWAVKANSGERKMVRAVPNLLAKLIYPDKQGIPEFPKSVWLYLNSVPSTSGKGLSRRELLIERWEGSKYCLIHKGHKANPKDRIKHLSGAHDHKRRLTIDVVEDRSAMLQDLRYDITSMEDALAEIFAIVRN